MLVLLTNYYLYSGHNESKEGNLGQVSFLKTMLVLLCIYDKKTIPRSMSQEK